MKTNSIHKNWVSYLLLPILFTILGSPIVMAQSVRGISDITETTAVCEFFSASYGDESGICWGTQHNPTIDNNCGSAQCSPVYGLKQLTVYGLTANTTYYIRVFTTDDGIVSYSEEASFTTQKWPSGTLPGLFSVAEGQQVKFSQGNLQYHKSKTLWRFTDKQWGSVKQYTYNSNYGYYVGPSDWFEYFGWATAGSPTSTFGEGGFYVAYSTDDNYNLYDQDGSADWGYNAIHNGGNIIAHWRTWSYEECSYMLFERVTPSGIRYVMAKVNDVNGMIILPDNWNASWYSLSNPNPNNLNFDDNNVTESEWTGILEPHGAVFLPAAGWRYERRVYDVGGQGYYWTSSVGDPDDHISDIHAMDIAFIPFLISCRQSERSYGESVRLITSDTLTRYTIGAFPNDEEGGVVTGDGLYVMGSTATLTATANEGYVFLSWSQDGTYVTNNPTLNVTVNKSKSYVANFYTTTTYSISATSNPTNGGTVTGSGTYVSGSTCTLTARPNTGYSFVRWTKNGSQVSNNPTYSFTVTENASYVAVFSLNNYTISVSANPSAGGTVSGGGTYNHGSSCTLTATPATGYTFVKWTKNGSQVSTNPTYSFTVTENASYVAVFNSNGYTISASANPSAGGTVSGGGSYNYGSSCTLTATPATGYTFVKWTKNGSQVSTNPTYSFTVTENASYVAVFSLNSYTISVSANPSSGGTVSGGGTYNYGSSCTLTATPAAGYTFVKWMKNGSQVSTNPTYGFGVTESASYVAVFSLNSYTISVSANPSAGGTVSGGGTYNYGSNCTLTATPATGYSFVRWTKNGSQVSTNPTYSFAVTENASYVAVFSLSSYTISVSANPSTGGTVSGGGTYNYGSSCTLSATPAPGYSFVRWTKNGSQVSTNTSYSFTVTENASYVAVFSINSYTISVSANPSVGGTVSGGGTYNYGSSCTLTALPATGYSFVRWTRNGNQVSTNASYSFSVTENANYVAVFEEEIENYIVFADPNVKAICVANWDTNGSGELSYAEAAAVTSLGMVFKGNTTITSFEELQYFTGLTSISSYAFYECSGLTGNLIIPNSVTSIGICAFKGCSGFTGSLSIPNSVTIIDSYAFHGCSGFTGSLIISNSVTTIERDAFNGCSGFTGSLTIPDSVTSIGAYAFLDCNGFTGSLIIGNSVTSIGDYAFHGCYRFSGNLTIPGSMITIGYCAFEYCSGFTGSLTIPNSVVSIGDYAFWDCIGFTGDLIIGNSVTSIGSYAFCNLRSTGSLIIGNSVISIGNNAFWGCDGFIGNLTIPNSVTTIGDNAFSSCTGLTSLTVLPETPPSLGPTTFGGGFTSIPIFVPCNSVSIYQTTEGWSMFANYHGIDCSSYSITATVNPIVGGTITGAGTHDTGTTCTLIATPNEGYVFNNWTENGEVVSTETAYTFTVTGDRDLVANFNEIEDYIVFADPNVKAICIANWDTNGSGELSYAEAAAVTDLGEVFRGNTEITSFEELQYFTGLTSISYAFDGCSGLTGSLIIPNSVTTIGYQAFDGCSGLTGSLTIPNSVTWIGDSAFRGCSGFTGSLTIPNSVTEIGDWAFSNCTGLTGSLTIGNSVTTIGNGAFQNCTGFTGELIIPNSVTYLSGFRGCTGFTGTLTIPNSVTTIGYQAFDGCSGFTGSLNIPNSVTSIGFAAFASTSFTGTLIIPNSVTSIGYRAFQGCSGFTGSLTIPNSVTEIVDWAFSNCTGLTGSLTIGNSVTTIGNGAFQNCTGFTGELIIPNSVTYLSGFDGCTGFTGTLTIPNSVTTIGYQAFNGCTGFTGTLTIPNSVTEIGNWAFGNCSGLTLLTLPNSVTTISNLAFYNCTGLTSMSVLSETPPSLGSDVFYFVPKSIPVYVPYNSIEAYQNAEGWNEFTNYQCIIHEYVDLGLPSGILWATYNVGAYSPEEYGDYFAWGETQPKDIYNWSTYQYCMGGYNTLTKYCGNSNYGYNGFTDNLTVLLPEDDAASTNWGEDWRMPTKEEWQELLDNTTDTWTTQNGVNGRMFTASNGNSLFLPAVGYREDSGLYNAGSDGIYWSSSLVTNTPSAWFFYLYSGNYGISLSSRGVGLSVRAVRENNTLVTVTATANPAESGTITGAGTFAEGSTCTLTATSNEGYEFVNWTENGEVVSTNATYSFTVTEERNLVANFSRNVFHFVTAGSWSNASNWSGGALPEANNEVFIDASCQLDMDATVNALTVSDGQSFTLQSGKTLTVTNTLINTVTTGLIIEDGAQLVHSSENVSATVKKSILGHGTNRGKYALISNPLATTVNPELASIYHLTRGNYDLYDWLPNTPDNLEWRNYKDSDFIMLPDGYGYLYANQNGVELIFPGTLKPSDNRFGKSVSYDSSNTEHPGWNLIGNPFACNAKLVNANNEPLPYYRMNAAGNAFELVAPGTPIAPVEGIFYKASVNEIIYFIRADFSSDPHEYVDLGLPSGLLWATCNVGAESPEDYGDYFAWGETESKDTYNWGTYQHCEGSDNTLTKYCSKFNNGYNGFTDNLITLLPEDDAATSNWGNGWRMPTNEELEELYNNTTVTWTIQNGVNGRLFTASNGNSLFLPAAGCRYYDILDNVGRHGYYWSSSLNTGSPYCTWFIYFDSVYYEMSNSGGRCSGLPVRAVREN